MVKAPGSEDCQAAAAVPESHRIVSVSETISPDLATDRASSVNGKCSGMATEASASSSTTQSNATSSTSVVTTAIAVVTPTARSTTTAALNTGSKSQATISTAMKMSPCQLPPQPLHARPMHQPVHPQIHHMGPNIPIPPPGGGASAAVAASAGWQLVDSVFHFGPGFEPQPYCPKHSQGPTPGHVVYFHVNPGVSVTFQVAGNREVVRGEYTFLHALFLLNYPHPP
ncbi:GS homeobox 2-like [Sergentomyia squamirostris]